MSYAAKAYSKTQVETDVIDSNSKELLVLVYERIIENLNIGKHELENGKYGIEFFTKANDLINIGLISVLDFEKGGEIAQNLKSIYLWCSTKILEGRIEKSPVKIQEVIDVLNPLYEAWASLIKKI